jgi:nucleoside-diphosphate-sugar epimerase
MINDLRDQRVGLIGANGFIGSAILQALMRTGVTPVALCGPSAQPYSLPCGVDSLTCDLTNGEALKSWVSGLDVIIHAAGPPSVQHSFEIPQEYVRVHVLGTAAVVHACHEANVGRLIYISSAEVYGRPEANPVGETHRLQARSPYAAAKIAAEHVIEAYARSLGLKAVILRPFSIYGPNPTPESLFGSIIAMAHSDGVRLRDLRPVRDYCYVGDLAQAVLKASCFAAETFTVLNIGTGKGTSVADFAALVLQSMGTNLPVLEDRPSPRHSQSEIFELVADISMIRHVLGWHPETELEEGLRRSLGDRPSNP